MSNSNIEIEQSEDEVIEVEVDGRLGVWAEHVESYFIGLIEDEVKKGNRPTTTLSKSSWNFIKLKLKEKTKKDYSQDQIKNKYNQLRQRWKDFSKLLCETGIGYNAITGKVFAEDDIWKKLYEKHKYAKTFRRKGCKHYDKLCIIFGDTTTKGTNSHSSAKSPSISEDEEDQDGDEEENSQKEVEEGPKPKKRKSSMNPKYLKESVHIAMADALTTMGENTKKKLELWEKKLSATSSNVATSDNGHQSQADHDNLIKCIDAISALDGIDGASFAKATKLIHDDPLWRNIFLRLSDDRKKDWVLNI